MYSMYQSPVLFCMEVPLKNPAFPRKHFHSAAYAFYFLLILVILALSSFAVKAADTAQPESAAEEPLSQAEDPGPPAAPLKGWQTIDGKRYYYNNGSPLTGLRTIGGIKYYFDPQDGGAMKTGFIKITRSGKSYTHYFVDENYTRYAPDKEGQMMTGWTTVSGLTYFLADSRFPKLPVGVRLTGFRKIGGSTFYFANSLCPDKPWAAQVTGWAKINGKMYYFADKNCPSEKTVGKMMTGLVKVSGRKYYFSSNGIRKTGFQTIDGKKYYFANSLCPDKPWASMVTGLAKIGEDTYFFNNSGVMQKGWVKVNGARMYFDKSGKHKVPVVVLDPGHSSQVAGGKEPVGPGASKKKAADTSGTRGVSTRVYDYQLALQISLKLRKTLEARGYRVIMTRSTNKGTYSCVERAQVANDNNADIFVRIHANADPNDSSRTGAMTICITKKNPYIAKMYKQSRLLSDKILNSYVKATGCKKEYVWERDDMSGNNWSKVPTTLIEMGYMTNAAEDKRMQKADYQKKMVSGIAAGIDQYFNSIR